MQPLVLTRLIHHRHSCCCPSTATSSRHPPTMAQLRPRRTGAIIPNSVAADTVRPSPLTHVPRSSSNDTERIVRRRKRPHPPTFLRPVARLLHDDPLRRSLPRRGRRSCSGGRWRRRVGHPRQRCCHGGACRVEPARLEGGVTVAHLRLHRLWYEGGMTPIKRDASTACALWWYTSTAPSMLCIVVDCSDAPPSSITVDTITPTSVHVGDMVPLLPAPARTWTSRIAARRCHVVGGRHLCHDGLSAGQRAGRGQPTAGARNQAGVRRLSRET